MVLVTGLHSPFLHPRPDLPSNQLYLDNLEVLLGLGGPVPPSHLVVPKDTNTFHKLIGILSCVEKSSTPLSPIRKIKLPQKFSATR